MTLQQGKEDPLKDLFDILNTEKLQVVDYRNSISMTSLHQVLCKGALSRDMAKDFSTKYSKATKFINTYINNIAEVREGGDEPIRCDDKKPILDQRNDRKSMDTNLVYPRWNLQSYMTTL